MGQTPIIVSHYTVKTGYEREVKNLQASLRQFQLEHWVVGIHSQGSWRYNSNWCAEQVRQALELYPNRDVLRVDADAVFRRYPGLFEFEGFTADVAAHVHDFPWHRNELMGGTLFFRNNEKVRELVQEWARAACKDPETREKRNGDLLQMLLFQERYSTLRFESLPATYCKIFDLMKDVRDPVIEHFQASRRFKKQINAGVKK